jgi:hypothetical protein
MFEKVFIIIITPKKKLFKFDLDLYTIERSNTYREEKMMKSMYFEIMILVIGITLVSGCVNPNEKIETRQIETIPVTTPSFESQTTTAPTTKSPAITLPPASPSPTTQASLEIEESDLLDLDEANVIGVEFRKEPTGSYTFSVTVRHNDTGWNHYSDWWRIKTLDGEEIERRVLAHPHETEQPFTRSLSGITIPDDIDKIIVEAHDNVHGYGGQVIIVDLRTGHAEVLV